MSLPLQSGDHHTRMQRFAGRAAARRAATRGAAVTARVTAMVTVVDTAGANENGPKECQGQQASKHQLLPSSRDRCPWTDTGILPSDPRTGSPRWADRSWRLPWASMKIMRRARSEATDESVLQRELVAVYVKAQRESRTRGRSRRRGSGTSERSRRSGWPARAAGSRFRGFLLKKRE